MVRFLLLSHLLLQVLPHQAGHRHGVGSICVVMGSLLVLMVVFVLGMLNLLFETHPKVHFEARLFRRLLVTNLLFKACSKLQLQSVLVVDLVVFLSCVRFLELLLELVCEES